MPNFKILSDSACDLPEDLIKKYDIGIVPYLVTFDGLNFLKDGVDITLNEFNSKLLKKGVFPKTSLPPIQDYVDKFRIYLEQGMDIMCVCLTAKFSGSFQCARTAADILLEEFPQRKMIIVDSASVTMLQGLLVTDIGEYRNQGKSMEEIYDIIESYKDSCRIFVTPDSLEHLQHGGRIGKASALAGALLNIKPIIAFFEGELQAHSKVRGRKKAVQEIVNLTAQELKGKEDEYRVVILHNSCMDDALEVQRYAKEKGIDAMGIFDIGITISVHIGPVSVATAFIKKTPQL